MEKVGKKSKINKTAQYVMYRKRNKSVGEWAALEGVGYSTCTLSLLPMDLVQGTCNPFT